jgi:ribonucleotide reductase alpha subunit
MDAAAGVLPVYAAFFREDNSTGKFPVVAMFLKENPLGYAKTFNMYKQPELAQLFGSMQQLIDTGISVEFLFDLNTLPNAAKDYYDTIMAAWKSGQKSIYYIRSIKKGQTIEDLMGFTDSGCVACAG